MNSATIFFVLTVVAATSAASITPATQEQQQAVQQQQMQQSVVQPVAIAQIPVDVYRNAYRTAYAIQAVEDQKASAVEDRPTYSLVQGGDGVVRYYAPYAVAPVAVGPVGRYLGHGLSFSPAARGFALGGLVGLGAGMGARSLMAGSLAGPIGLGIHSALSTPALGIGLGAGAAALLG